METAAQRHEHSPHNGPYSELFAAHMAEKQPDITLTPTGVAIVGSNLDFVRATYGNPDTPTYLHYHNDPHSYGVTTRTLWQLAMLQKALRLPLTDRDYELAALAASAHDIVKGSLRTGDQISIPVGEATITLQDDGTKSDERLSAEFTTQAMTLAGDYSATDRNRVASAILATEVTFEGMKVSLKHVNETIRDPIVVSLMIADTNDIFARSRDVVHAIGENVSDLSLEILRSGGSATSDVISKTVGDLLKYQSEFLKDRRDDYALLTSRLIDTYDTSDQYDTLRTKFQAVTTTAVSFAEQLEANADKVVSDFRSELAQLRESSLGEQNKIRRALMQALNNLPPSK